jgi:hypothetical protein
MTAPTSHADAAFLERVWTLQKSDGASVVCDLYYHPTLGYELRIGPAGDPHLTRWAPTREAADATAAEMTRFYPDYVADRSLPDKPGVFIDPGSAVLKMSRNRRS